MISCLVEVSSSVDDQSSDLKMTIETADEKGSGAIVICYVRTEVVFEVGGGLGLFEEPPEEFHGKILNTKQKYEKNV